MLFVSGTALLLFKGFALPVLFSFSYFRLSGWLPGWGLWGWEAGGSC